MAINLSWAVEQVKGWASTNTNSINPQFKECLNITVALAEEALRLSEVLASIERLKKGEG